MAESKSMYEDPTLYLYTSLTAGSSHIITATSRMETILKANRISFQAIDCATDEKARMLWGRRSKGKRLPGLVKYGTIIGDLNEVEEWNEYGELKEQIDSASDLAGPFDAAPSKPAPTLAPQKPEGPVRASSATRHISISEPSGGRKSSTDLSSPTGGSKQGESPLSMAMRQAGAEAAARAGQKKSVSAPVDQKTTATPSDIAPATPSNMPSDLLDPTEQKPSDLAEMTAAKTPDMLAAEGVHRSSIDKADTSPDRTPSSPGTHLEASPSNQEQLLQMRRSSSVIKVPSKLHTATPAEEESDPIPSTTDESDTTTAPATKAAPESERSTSKVLSPITSISSDDITPTPARKHRGSSLGDASREEIAAIEAKNMIKEEDEEGAVGDGKHPKNESAIISSPPSGAQTPVKGAVGTGTGASKLVESVSATDLAEKIGPTDEQEEKATRSIDPQKTEAKDADAAGVSVGD